MKLIIKSTILIITLSVSLTSVANSSASTKKVPLADEKSVNAKCFVQLVGGGETISLWLVKPSLLKSLRQTIVGQEIVVIETQKEANIYRAKECVLEEDDFRDARARTMDKELPR